MKLLLDECVPRPLRNGFAGHEVITVEEAGFKGLKNGELLRSASENFDILITVDKGIQHQQNLSDLPLSVLLLSSPTNKLEQLEKLL